mmetsp:Transcript_85374/g.174104  ORF Transcript_85374/g.174104 Transcript_85374/m.174104 type:complete len:356 (+) Transcript_85374:62-1129(+)
MDAAHEYLEAQLPKQTEGCLEEERCGSLCTLCCPVLSDDCGASVGRSDDSEDSEPEEPHAAHLRLTRSLAGIKRSPARSRRPSMTAEARSRLRSPYMTKPVLRGEELPRRTRPSMTSTISSNVGTLTLPAEMRPSRWSLSSQTSQPSIRSRRVTYKYSQLIHRVPKGSRRASLPPVYVGSRVSAVPFEVRIRPRRTSSVVSSRRPSTVGSATPVWPRDSLGASRTSSVLSSSRSRSLVSGRWTLPSQSSSPLLSSSERLPISQVVALPVHKIASGTASTYSGHSVNTGTPPQQSPADTPPMATVIETTEVENVEAETRLKAVRFRQGSASIIGSPMDEKIESLELNSRAGSFGGA